MSKQRQVQKKPAPHVSPPSLASLHNNSSWLRSLSLPDSQIPVQQNFGLSSSNRGFDLTQIQVHAPSAMGIQAKLTVGAPGDKYEQQADAIADRVISMSAPTSAPVQREMTPEDENQNKDEEILQTQPVSEEKSQVDRNLEAQLQSSKGSGSPLPDNLRTFMEPRFGVDFSRVRLHTDSRADNINRDLNAQAATHGNNIYFAPGKYNPASLAGKHLLAHELTHVVQQNSMVNRIQRAVKSPRFAGNTNLSDASENKGDIKRGATGLHVRIIQQALLDAGQTLPKYGVNGIFEQETEDAVKGFQNAKKLTETGIVDSLTMTALDNFFLDRQQMAKIPQGQVPSTPPSEGVEWKSTTIPPELLKGTRSLSPEEKAEVERRRTTEVQAPKGGSLPVFQMKIPTHKDSYENRVEEITNKIIDGQYKNLAKDKASARKDPNKLYKWDIIEKIAALSKKEADRVFGNYATGKAFKANVNLMDAWKDKEKQFASGGKPYEQSSVEWRVEKIFGGQQIRVIDQEHGAVQSRPTEKKILTDIRDRIIAKRRAELIEIHKGWPGFADDGKIYLQRFVSADDAKNRDAMWHTFQTVVHEYIHTLEHSKHVDYRKKLGELKGGKTYREGMTEYFTHIVLSSVNYNQQLRKDVEASYHDPTITHPIPRYFGYDEAKNAEAVVGIVGIRNAMAAFFTGRVDLIGG